MKKVNQTNTATITFEKLVENAILPKKVTQFSTGYDLYSIESCIIKPNEIKAIRTGLKVSIENTYKDFDIDLQIRPRSGLALKNKVTVLNTPGTIDSDYRGEIKIILINLGQEDFVIEQSARIAQLVVGLVAKNVNLQIGNVSLNTLRGDGGFGSTGV